MSEPGCRDYFDFGDPVYFEELIRLQNAALREPGAVLNPEWLFYTRQLVGLAYLLYRLGIAGRFADMFHEIVETPQLRGASAEEAGSFGSLIE